MYIVTFRVVEPQVFGEQSEYDGPGLVNLEDAPMFRCAIRRLVAFGIINAVIVFVGSVSFHAQVATAGASGSNSDACALLTPADIAKATGLTVGNGTAGPPIPGVLGKCTWIGSGNTKVIVTLADLRHMQITIAAQEQTGGTSVPDVGSRAVGIEGAGFTGGGYIISVLDAKGGFGVSILGKEGTRDRAVALAKLVEAHR